MGRRPSNDGGSSIIGYQYQVNTNGGGFGPWNDVAKGDNTGFTQSCGAGNTCAYNVRAVNAEFGSGAAGGTPSAAGSRATLTAPSPKITSAQEHGQHRRDGPDRTSPVKRAWMAATPRLRP